MSGQEERRDEEVRERSPLHEVGEGGWGGRGEEEARRRRDEEEEGANTRDKFRIRVRRTGSTANRGPLVRSRRRKRGSSAQGASLFILPELAGAVVLGCWSLLAIHTESLRLCLLLLLQLHHLHGVTPWSASPQLAYGHPCHNTHSTLQHPSYRTPIKALP